MCGPVPAEVTQVPCSPLVLIDSRMLVCLADFSVGSLLEREYDRISVSSAALGLCKQAANFGDT